jgi:pimeloyl-ACP methyl ester carboxylesterase
VAELHLTAGALDGVTLHYVEAGHRGPTVVLVHGLGGCAASWAPTIAALAPHARVLAPDLPGFGRSAKPRLRYGLDLFTAALEGFASVLRLGAVSVVGHSLGGAVALAWALGQPDRVERVALLGGLVPGVPYRPSVVYRILALRGVGETLALLGSRPVYRAAVARCLSRPRPEVVRWLVDQDYAARTSWAARAAYLGTVRAVREDLEGQAAAFRRALSRWGVPALLIHGRQDPVVPAAHCRAAGTLLPRAYVRWLDDCGHFPQLEHPEAVHDWLVAFVAPRPAPR